MADIKAILSHGLITATAIPTVPSVGDVEEGVEYGIGGNEFTGTFGVPTEAQVSVGVGYGEDDTEFTGTLTIPFPGIDTTVYESILTMTCTIQRDTQTGTDESGKKMPPSWEDIATGVDCFFEPESVRDTQIQEIITAKTVVDNIQIMFKGDVDINTKDRVKTIVRKLDASVVQADPLTVLEVNPTDSFDGSIFNVTCILKREEGS